MIVFYTNNFLKIEKYENSYFYKNAYINDEKHYIVKENKTNCQPHILKHPKIYKKKISLENFEVLNEKRFNYKNEKVYICFHQYESNFHHFMFDSFYQIFGYLELKKQIPDLKIFTSHIQGGMNEFRQYIFDLFEIKDVIYFKRLEKRNTLNFHFNEIYVPEISNVFNFFNELNQKLLKIHIEKPIEMNTYNKLFIIRYESSLEKEQPEGKRILLNSIEISNYLKKFGYKTVKLQDYNLLEKYKLIQSAYNIIVELGASCDNLIFCNKNCNVKILTTNIMTNSWIKYHQNLLKNLYLKGEILKIGITTNVAHHFEMNYYIEKKDFKKLI